MVYDRIAMQVYQAFGIKINKHIVRRVLAKHYKPGCPCGPSWLTFLIQTKDSLWSIDLFRCESIQLKTFWFMLAIDISTRRIIGFATHASDVDGIAACRLFNQIMTGHGPVRPEYSCSLMKIDMVKTLDGRKFNNVAGLH